MENPDPAITRLLRSWGSGDASAGEELMPLVYDRLRSLAASHLRHERPGHTLAATALVNEAYLKIADASIDYQDRVHFFAVASTAMRRVLVDYAKHHKRQRRGGGVARADFDEALAVSANPDASILEIDEALTELAKVDPRKVRIVELTYFGGLSNTETAKILGLSEPTIKRELRMARAWIKDSLQSQNGE
ncbi:MAG TPA: sigma-70 family RNA polymerase sigma factor [Bryobacteraceae bacterium]|nr:sigma-70 family RNA polymerase sigma factor [Bryobacteraceae bacterium]